MTIAPSPRVKRFHTFIPIIFLIGIALSIVLFANFRNKGTMTTSISSAAYEESSPDNAFAMKELSVDGRLAGIDADIMMPTPVPPVADTSAPFPEEDRRIIKTGNLAMRINDLDRTLGEIAHIAREHGGAVMHTSFSTLTNDRRNGYLTLKVPSQEFDTTFAKLKAIASHIENESIDTQDVTMQFVDFEAQLKNKKREEGRFLILFDRTDNIDEILKVERQLSRVRGEIESIEGQLKYLTNQSDFSTITITLTEDDRIIVTDSWRPTQVAIDAFNELIRKSKGILNAAIAVSITYLPLFIGSIIVLVILYRLGQKAMRYYTRKYDTKD